MRTCSELILEPPENYTNYRIVFLCLYFQEWSRGAVRARDDGKSTKKKKKKKYKDEIMTESEVCERM